MAEMKGAPLLLKVDASELLIQVGDLVKLLELPASSFQGIPEHFIDLVFNRIRSLIDNIAFTDFAATISASNVDEIILKVKIIGPLEEFATAVRTRNFESLIFLHKEDLSSVGENKD